MSKHDPKVTLRQIAEYARHAQELCAGKTLAQIRADWRDAFAFERVMRRLKWSSRGQGLLQSPEYPFQIEVCCASTRPEKRS